MFNVIKDNIMAFLKVGTKALYVNYVVSSLCCKLPLCLIIYLMFLSPA